MKHRLIACCLLFFTTFSVAASFTAITFNDQWDKPIAINADTTLVLFAADMDGGDIIRDALTSLDIKPTDNHWVYVANISGMPSLISKLFALPKMRDYTFSIALDTEGDVTKNWSGKAEQATVFVLDQLTLTKTQHFPDVATLVNFLTKQQTR